MNTAPFITIPRQITGNEELIVMSRRMLTQLLSQRVSEEKVLQWSREAKKMKKEGKLPLLRSLRDLR